MATAYKSDFANTVAQKYGANIPADSLSKLLNGDGDYSPGSTLSGMITDMKELERSIYGAAIRPGVPAVVYKATDYLKITSPKQRLTGIVRKLETHATKLGRQIKAQRDSLETLSDRLKDHKKTQRDAKNIYVGLSDMGNAVIDEITSQNTKVAEYDAKAKQEPVQAEQLRTEADNCVEQIEKLTDDVKDVAYLKKRAAAKVVMSEQKIAYAEHEKQVRRCALDYLEDMKNAFDLQISEAKVICETSNSPMIDVFKQMQQAYTVYDSSLKSFGNLSEEINKRMTEIAGTLHFEPPNVAKVQERTKDLVRAQDRSASDVERKCEEIIRRDRKPAFSPAA